MATRPSKTNLIAWWDLEEESGTRYDSHGANHLADNNTVGFAPGVPGNSADFERDNSEFLSIADNPALSFANEDFTLGAWVYAESYNAQSAGIMGKWSIFTGDNEYMLEYSAGTSKFRFMVSSNGTNLTTVTAISAGVGPGAWKLIFAWHDSVNNELAIQVNNGAIDKALGYSAGAHDGALNFNIGQTIGGINYWDGLIDGAMVYNRILSADEHEWLYAAGAGRVYANLAPPVSLQTGLVISPGLSF
jgi:hypothetical protein